jgi:Wiskott-Aldrich syndrome protein
MTPDPEAKKAKLEAILGRLRSNRAQLGHPGHAVTPSTDSVEPVTLPLQPAARPGSAVVAAAAPAPVTAMPQRPMPVVPPRAPAFPVAPPPGAPARPLPPPPVVAPPPPPPPPPAEPEVLQAGHWEGEDEEEMILEEAPELVEAPAAPAPAAEAPLAAVPARPAEVAPPPPPPLPSTTVSPTVATAPVAAPAPAPAPAPPPPEEEARPQRIEALAPVEAPVVRTSGSVAPPRSRTIGELFGAALRLFETS